MSDQSLLSSRAIIGRFYETLEQSNQNNWAQGVGMRFTSDQESETYRWLGQSPMLREWVGGRQAKALRVSGITIENKRFESTLGIDLDDLRRDKTGQIMVRVDEMADRASAHWVQLMTTLITANGTSYDGKAFFASDHEEGDSGALVNDLTNTQVASLNVATASDPTPDEVSKALLGVIAYMYSYVDDQGEPINENAREFVVVVPTNLWSPFQQAVSKNLLSTGTGAIDNPLQGIGLRIRIVANPRLNANSTTKFYVFRVDGRAKPFILQEEEELSTSMLGEGSEEEFKNNRWLFGAKAIRNAGYGLWQQALRCTLS